MNLLTEPVIKHARTGTDTNTVNEWLDALSMGSCDQDTFLRGVGDLLQRAPDAGWELLALVDQYYRRGKISAETFGSVKAHLQTQLMGKGRGSDMSVPLPRPPEPATSPPSPVAASVPLPRPPERPTPPPSSVAVSVPLPRPPERPTSPSPVAASVPLPRPPDTRVAKPVQDPMPIGPVTGPVRPAASSYAPPPTPDSEPAQTASTAAERTLAPGDVLRGRYRVQAKLGQGGMGTVFEAIDQYRLDRAYGDQRVALKVLHTAVIQRPRLFAELRREFQHLQSLSHPNIVRVHEFDRDGDLAFFTMEYLSGALLVHVIATHAAPLPRPYALAIVRDVGAAVAHAHSRGVVHGDLNPGNIFITDGGEVRVVDFGAANQLRRAPWISEFENSQQLTVATPTYASCQLLEGETPDARDDVYALACIAYVLLTGKHPFGGHDALKARTLRLTPRRPAGLDRRRWTALRTGLLFERERRPSDMQAWLRQLDLSAGAAHLPVLPTLLTTAPAARTFSLRWMAACGIMALVALGIWWTAAHMDTLRDMQASLGATLRSRFANTVISQLWEDDHRGPAEGPGSASPPVPTAAPEVGTPTPLPAPSNASVRPPPVSPAAPPVHAAAPVQKPVPAAPLPPSTPAAGTASLATPSGTARPTAAPAPAVAATNALHARIELGADSVDVPPAESAAHVIVRRTRSLRGDVSFNWWTESGTAKPGRDFTPVKSHVEDIPDGKSAVDLAIPVVADPGRHEPRSFYVVIDEASDNAALGPRTLTMVTLPGPE
jgi:serine/threonine protein kinase